MRVAGVLLVLASVLWSGVLPAAAQEEILSFNSRFVIKADASIEVIETVKVRAAGFDIKRGIYRDFPTTYVDKAGRKRRIPFDVLGVERDGTAIDYWVETVGTGKRVYMGSKDHLLASGVYVFRLRYATSGLIGYFDGFDELYWNATGNFWKFPILSASATIVLPAGTRVLQRSAYTGPRGAHGRDYATRTDDDGNLRFSTTRRLAPGEGLTVAVGWPKGVVAEPVAPVMSSPDAALWIAIAAVLLVLGYYLLAWRIVGRDSDAGAIIPLFEPPEGLSPAAVRYVSMMRFDRSSFAAAVVSMAVKGHLIIDESGSKYTLRKTDDVEAGLSPGEKAVKQRLFAGRGVVRVDDANHEKFSAAIDGLKDTLKSEYGEAHFKLNFVWFAIGAVLSIATLLIVVSTGGNEFDYLTLVFMAIPVFVLFSHLSKITRLRGVKMVAGIVGLLIFVGFLSLAGSDLIVIFFDGLHDVSIVAVFTILALNPIFQFLLKAPTITGRKVMDEIEGFKMYLSVAEKERLEFIHPPEETPELFEKLLPYALALGVEHQWSERFSTLLSAAATDDGGGYHPRWYRGRDWSDGGFGRVTDRLGSGFSSALASAAVDPTSSSGSSGSGFSGGGGGGGF